MLILIKRMLKLVTKVVYVCVCVLNYFRSWLLLLLFSHQLLMHAHSIFSSIVYGFEWMFWMNRSKIQLNEADIFRWLETNDGNSIRFYRISCIDSHIFFIIIIIIIAICVLDLFRIHLPHNHILCHNVYYPPSCHHSALLLLCCTRLAPTPHFFGRSTHFGIHS